MDVLNVLELVDVSALLDFVLVVGSYVVVVGVVVACCCTDTLVYVFLFAVADHGDLILVEAVGLMGFVGLVNLVGFAAFGHLVGIDFSIEIRNLSAAVVRKPSGWWEIPVDDSE